MTMKTAAEISLQAAKMECARLAQHYDMVVVGTGKKESIWDRPYYAQRRDTAMKYGNPIHYDPKVEAKQWEAMAC